MQENSDQKSEMASLPHGWHHNVDPPTTKNVNPPPPKPSLSSHLNRTSHIGARSSMPTRKIPVRVNSNGVNGAIPNITELAEPSLINGKDANGHATTAGINGYTGTTKPRARWNIPASGNASKTTESLQLEMASMKKELAALRDENNQLKNRLRRLSDDNAKKAKQIEKLLMTGEESLGNERRKVPSAESVPVLRQKCSRLESSLKEKEAIVRKLQSDRMVKMQETKFAMDGYQKEITSLKNQINKLTSNGPKTNSLSGTWTQRSRAGPSQLANKVTSVAENNSIEVARLRDMLHKLQQDNQKMAQQIKEKNQELKQLKVQFQKSTQPTRAGSHPPQSTPGAPPAVSAVKAKSPDKSVTSVTSKEPRKAIPQTRANILKANASRSKLLEPSSARKPTSSSLNKKASSPATSQPKSSTLTKKKPQNATGKPQKVVLKAKAPAIPSRSEQIESKMKELRENVAAKKIQRSWRSHRQKQSTLDTEEQALLLLQSTLRGHKVRVDHLESLPKDSLMLDSEEDMESATEALHKLTSEYA